MSHKWYSRTERLNKSNPSSPKAKGHLKGVWGSQIQKILERCQIAGPIVNKFGTRMQIRLHVNGHTLAKKISPSRPRGALWMGGGGVRGHILKCWKTATNTCV